MQLWVDWHTAHLIIANQTAFIMSDKLNLAVGEE